MPLTLLRHATQKPSIGPLKLDIDNSLSQSLLHAWALPEYGSVALNDATVQAGAGSILSNCSWASTSRGPVVRCTVAATTNPITFGTESALNLPTGANCTVMLHYHKTDATLRNSGGFGGGVFTSTTARLGAHLPFGDGTVYWDYGGSGGTNRLSIGGLSFGDDIWAFTVGDRGAEIWQNGINRATAAGSHPTRTNDTSNWGLFDHCQAGSDLAESAFIYVWGRQLAVAEIAAVSAEPYSMFQTRPMQRWFTVVSAGGATIPPGLGPVVSLTEPTLTADLSSMMR